MEGYFVTGASKGIGRELIQQLALEGHFVVGIARSVVEVNGVHFIQADLGNSVEVQSVFEKMFQLVPKDLESFTLINNAGVIDPIGKVGDIEGSDIEKSVALNLTAPMLLSSAFIQQLKDFNGQKRIINISSGAGRKPYEGWASYCATKAGLDHFSRVVALEQQAEKNPVQIVSIAPGIIDTGMQEKIRSSSEEAFPLIERFKDYKANEQLSSPEETASKLIAFMKRMDANNEPILDLRNL